MRPSLPRARAAAKRSSSSASEAAVSRCDRPKPGRSASPSPSSRCAALPQRRPQERLRHGAGPSPLASRSKATKITGVAASTAALGRLRPSRPWSCWNGRAVPSRQASSSPSRMPDQVRSPAAAMTSGNWPETSCRSRLYRRVSPPCRCSWARMPSYLSSTQTGVPSRATTSATSAAGEASIDLSGRKSVSSASSRRSSRASSAVWPRSPVSMPAHCTAGSGRPNAAAIAGLQVALAEADAHVATHDLDEVLGDQRVAAPEERPQQGGPWRWGRRPWRWRRTCRARRSASAARPRGGAASPSAGRRRPGPRSEERS